MLSIAGLTLMAIAGCSPMLFRLAESRLGLWKFRQFEIAAQSFRIVGFVLFALATCAFVGQAIFVDSVTSSDWIAVVAGCLLTSTFALIPWRSKSLSFGINVLLGYLVLSGLSLAVSGVAFIVAASLIARFLLSSDARFSDLIFEAADFRIIRSSITDVLGLQPKAKMHFTDQVIDRCRGPRRVVLTPTHVVKFSEAAAARLELLRTSHAAELANDGAEFVVPTVESSDVETGSIAFQRLYGFEPLWVRLYRDPSSATDLLEQCGRALAGVHDAEIPIGWPESDTFGVPWNDGSTAVPLHGDFNVWNVMVHRKSNQLAIIDWATSDVCPGATFVGPCQFDVIWFIVSLHRHRYGGVQKLANISRMAQVFVDAYCCQRNISVERSSFPRYLKSVLPEVERIFNPSRRRLRQRVQRFLNFGVDVTSLKRLQLSTHEEPTSRPEAA